MVTMLKNKYLVWKRIKFRTFWYNCYYFTWSDTYFIQLETLLTNHPSYYFTLLKLSISVQLDNALYDEPENATEKFKYTSCTRKLLSFFIFTVRLRVWRRLYSILGRILMRWDTVKQC